MLDSKTLNPKPVNKTPGKTSTPELGRGRGESERGGGGKVQPRVMMTNPDGTHAIMEKAPTDTAPEYAPPPFAGLRWRNQLLRFHGEVQHLPYLTI